MISEIISFPHAFSFRRKKRKEKKNHTHRKKTPKPQLKMSPLGTGISPKWLFLALRSPKDFIRAQLMIQKPKTVKTKTQAVKQFVAHYKRKCM